MVKNNVWLILGKSQESEMPHTSFSGYEYYIFISDKMGDNASNAFDASI